MPEAPMTSKVEACRAQAAECTRLAQLAGDERARLLFLSMQMIWLNLAHNYEFIEGTRQFINTLGS
jgi:hypothetical protein